MNEILSKKDLETLILEMLYRIPREKNAERRKQQIENFKKWMYLRATDMPLTLKNVLE